jgi:hypothetical protein
MDRAVSQSQFWAVGQFACGQDGILRADWQSAQTDPLPGFDWPEFPRPRRDAELQSFLDGRTVVHALHVLPQ